MLKKKSDELCIVDELLLLFEALSFAYRNIECLSYRYLHIDEISLCKYLTRCMNTSIALTFVIHN